MGSERAFFFKLLVGIFNVPFPEFLEDFVCLGIGKRYADGNGGGLDHGFGCVQGLLSCGLVSADKARHPQFHSAELADHNN